MSVKLNSREIQTIEFVDGLHIKSELDLVNKRIIINVIGLSEEDHTHDISTIYKDGFISAENTKKLLSTPSYNDFKESYNYYEHFNIDTMDIISKNINNEVNFNNLEYKYYLNKDFSNSDLVFKFNLDQPIKDIKAFIGIDFYINGLFYKVKSAKVIKEDKEKGYNLIYFTCNNLNKNIQNADFQNDIFELIIRYIGS